jgi:hypothetical protein
MHWVIAFEIDVYRLVCERKWVCQDGVYVATGETRVQQSGPDRQVRRFEVDGEGRTAADVRKAWLDARQMLNAAAGSEAAMDTYRANCR